MEEYDVGFNLWNAIITILSIVAGAIGFIIRRVFKKLDEVEVKAEIIEKEVSELKLKVAEEHPNKDDFLDFKYEITQMLIQFITPINTKLENIESYLRNNTLKRKDD